MKQTHKSILQLVLPGLLVMGNLMAQVDMSHKITNPSFETGNLSGWTWHGASGYSWLGPNTDGDLTKNGNYICGIWNDGIADAECSQVITGLESGYYQVRALATVSVNRLSNQRLFANLSSQLYGVESAPSYSEHNLSVLEGLGETYTFAGHAESSAENGPFKPMSVVTRVEDGTLKIGFKVSGRNTTQGFVFPLVAPKRDEGFFKFDHFQLFEVSKVAELKGISLSSGSLNKPFNPDTTHYTATLPAGTKQVKPTVLFQVEGQTVTGDDEVDISSGILSSELVVTSIDGTTTKTYTIDYELLEESYRLTEDGVEMIVPNGSMQVKICSPAIVEVTLANQSPLPLKDSIIVERTWDIPSFEVEESDECITITTEKLVVEISKLTCLLKYYDSAGNLLLAESEKNITPVTVLGFETNQCKAVFESPEDEALYGLGQHQQRIMNHKGHQVVLDQQNKEVALPFLLSTKGYGLLWDNYSQTVFSANIANNSRYQFDSESGSMVNYYFMYGPEPDDVINQYRIATGAAPMFPKWAYGLFQSKDKYGSAQELLTMVNKYRANGFPLDCIVQDWDYWTPDPWGSHIMNPTRYPDPKALVDSLHALNVHTMISIWPVFHRDARNFSAFDNIGALYPSGGSHHFYDPHNDEAKEIYWNQLKTQLFSNYGWDAWWADNNEPQGYPDAVERKNFMTAKGSGVTYYNTYPIEHTSGFYRGWRKDIPDKRAFVLSRSAFSGQQRYATAVWSGDINSNWYDFQTQLSAGLNFCLSGMPYWTTDIGGYFYIDWYPLENNELMVRWFQYGAFCPIFRIHGQGEKSLVSTTTLRRSTIANLAKIDNLRYRLMPYIYSLAGKVTHENYTMMRHLIMDYRNDTRVRNIDNQFMLGPALMVNPVTTPGATERFVYLPQGDWVNFWTGEYHTGGKNISAPAPLDIIPLFVKAGSIIPMGPFIQYASEAVDPLEIRVYKGADGEFVLYEDEGDTYNYEDGAYAKIPFQFNYDEGKLTIGQRVGSFEGMLTERTFKIVLVDKSNGIGPDISTAFDTVVHYVGNEVIVDFDPERLIVEKEDSQTEINFVTESFDYPVGGLHNQGEAGNGWKGPWTVYEGTQSDATIVSGSGGEGTPATGNKLLLNLSSSQGLRVARELSPGWTVADEDIWISFRMEIDNPNSIAATWQGISLFDGTQERLLIGKDWEKSVLGLSVVGTASGLSTVSAFNLPATLLVVKLQFTANLSQVPVYMWINPDLSAEPDVAEAVTSITIDLSNGFNRIVCHSGNTAGVSASFDELRIGRSYEMVTKPLTDVLPVKSDHDVKMVFDRASQTLKVNFNAFMSDDITFSIVDVNGRELHRLTKALKAGVQHANINLAALNLSAGVYIVSIKAGDHQLSSKIIL